MAIAFFWNMSPVALSTRLFHRTRNFVPYLDKARLSNHSRAFEHES
jgi:hypothetical protein